MAGKVTVLPMAPAKRRVAAPTYDKDMRGWRTDAACPGGKPANGRHTTHGR